MSESWKTYELDATKSFNPIACLNPIILKECSEEELQYIDQKDIKNIFSKKVSATTSNSTFNNPIIFHSGV